MSNVCWTWQVTYLRTPDISGKVYNVLFLCTHNSARSILSEALLNHLGKGRFKAYSAGSSPRENQKPNPLALETLTDAGISVEGLHSKSWDAFGAPDAPKMDFVITVCDNAAGEVCPFWLGQPLSAHWGVPDPSEVKGDAEASRKAFADTLKVFSRRIALMVNLPIETLDRFALQEALAEIGREGA